MKKILVDAYCNKNFGDDLFLKILFERYKDTHFTLLNAPIEYKEIFPNIEIKNTSKLQRLLSRFNLSQSIESFVGFIMIGGSMFMQNKTWKKDYYKKNNVISGFSVRNKKVFILGSNFGSFKDEFFIKSYESIFEKCTDICFRETYSYDLFNHMPNVRVAPDIVFQLRGIKSPKAKNTVGFSLINLENREDLKSYSNSYITKMMELIKSYIISGKQVTLFSFCEAEGDLDIIKQIKKRIDQNYLDNIKVCNYTGNVDDFLNEFSRMEVIIGSRFHSIILAQVFNQGFYPLIYSDKTYNVLKDTQLNNYYKYIKNIDELNTEEVINVAKNNKIVDNSCFSKSEGHFKELDSFLIRN
ncbi:polysaccharide pyruvyl transferase family protein [Cytobacillus firmus]|uniref:polysaccharide pyruvyl transferase family protein n=1 Tax=Cytobacillus pseudoceanisediminis TaxID=3051614 RepID=UPI00216180EA|nr:polysaccharide pyruvyl transferase family protein [Cytobacillus firmus]